MLDVNVDDLATPVIRKVSAATKALREALGEAEGFRGRRECGLLRRSPVALARLLGLALV
jgi:hypothetical protein